MKINFLKRNKLSDAEQKVWNVLFWILAGGVFMLLLLSSYHIFIEGKVFSLYNISHFLSGFGIVMLIGGACYCGGIFLGFIFGIPRIIQNPSLALDQAKQRETFAYNDNLAQISDWLTKILVGVGLTQLTKIPSFLHKVGDFLQPSFPGGRNQDILWQEVARNGSIATVLYFSIAGFLTAYLWTSIFFSKMLSGPGENDDPQKGKWGGKPEVNGRKMSAAFGDKDKDTNEYAVTVTVASTDPVNKPLTGVVIFYLPADINNGVQSVPVANGEATLKFSTSRAFAIGAECDCCETKLELDLRDVADVPKEWVDK